MKLKRVTLNSFRSINETTFSVGNLVSLIGENNQGKSNILRGLQLFFSDDLACTKEDLFNDSKKVAEETYVECAFDGLTAEEAEALKPWVIDGEIILRKAFTFNPDRSSLVCKGYMASRSPETWKREFTRKMVNIQEVISFYRYSTKNYSGTTRPAYVYAWNKLKRDKTKVATQTPVLFPLRESYLKKVNELLPRYYFIPAQGNGNSPASIEPLLATIMEALIWRMELGSGKLADLNAKLKELEESFNDSKEAEVSDFRSLEKVLNEYLNLWGVKARMKVDFPRGEELLKKVTYIALDDGIETRVNDKGDGVKRNLLLALIRIVAEGSYENMKGGKISGHRSSIFAIEEPELYLHPHMCRAMYDALTQISSENQVILCTHSPHFVDLEDYDKIVIVRKKSISTGTTTRQVRDESFLGTGKRRFDLVRYFNPDRNEMFFSRKVVLVEGPTEKSIVPFLGKKIGVFDHSISIIDCGGKHNMPLFIQVLNELEIPYLAIHDEDPIAPELMPGGSKYDENKFRMMKATFDLNQTFRNLCTKPFSKELEVKGDFERLLGISQGAMDKYGKPYAAMRKFSVESAEIGKEVADLVKEVFRPPS